MTDNSDIPVDTRGDHLLWDGNKAHISGLMAEAHEYYTRTGKFIPLITSGCVLLNNGITAVESIQAVTFITGIVQDPPDTEYKLSSPCPDTATRFAKTNLARTAAGQTAHAPATIMPAGFETAYRISKLTIAKEDSDFLVSLTHIFGKAPGSERLIKAAAGSGRALIKALMNMYATEVTCHS